METFKVNRCSIFKVLIAYNTSFLRKCREKKKFSFTAEKKELNSRVTFTLILGFEPQIYTF